MVLRLGWKRLDGMTLEGVRVLQQMDIGKASCFSRREEKEADRIGIGCETNSSVSRLTARQIFLPENIKIFSRGN